MIDYLLCPSFRHSDGGGHISRMFLLHSTLASSAIYIPESEAKRALNAFPFLAECEITHGIGAVKCIVIDYPWIATGALLELERMAPVVAVDLGGRSRNLATYLIDTLPYPGIRLHEKYFSKQRDALGSGGGRGMAKALEIPAGKKCTDEPNYFSPGLLHLPETRKPADGKTEKILVSFGATDPGDLTGTFIRQLHASPWLAQRTGEIIIGSHNKRNYPELPAGWAYIKPDPGLSEKLSAYDLVFCAYGLLAWEAQSAGAKAVVIDASFYHRELARKSGFQSIGSRHLKYAFPGLEQGGYCDQLVRQSSAVQKIKDQSLSFFIRQLHITGRNFCPCCGEFGYGAAIARNPRRSYFKCRSCGAIYLVRFVEGSISYDSAYFFKQYNAQYGKTYLEDFQHIKDMGKKRLRRISRYCSTDAPAPRLLDIGCAYGPFLSAASEAGYEPEGVEVNSDAAEYVKRKLGFTAHRGSILDSEFRNDFSSDSYDAVTMWYVIEHFSDLSEIFAWIWRILKPCGSFSFATPCSTGVSGRKDIRSFLFSGPEDHFSIWNPLQAEKLLSLQGFTIEKRDSTGHHPERFPGITGTRLMRPVSALLSRMFSLGDGLEVHAIKNSLRGKRPVNGRENGN